MIAPEAIAAFIAGIVSIIGVIANYLLTAQARKHDQQLRALEQKASEERLKAELTARREEWQLQLITQEQQWQESFRAELRRNLAQESTLEIVRLRMKCYAEIWKELRITGSYEWKNLADPKASVQQLVDRLTDIAYGEIGMIMSDRSRLLLTNFRAGCAAFIREEISAEELIDRAHQLKHSMRSDLGIIDHKYESDLNAVADRLGRVDDWQRLN
jgi:hypothetical protein